MAFLGEIFFRCPLRELLERGRFMGTKRQLLLFVLAGICGWPVWAADSPNWPNGYALAAYLDCGRQERADGDAGVSVRLAKGRPWTFPGVEGELGTAVLDDAGPVFEVSGLDTQGEYVAALTWWDADNQGRVQSVYMGAPDAEPTCVLPPTPAKAFYEDKPTWAAILLPLPAAAIKKGSMMIEVRRDAGPDGVVNAFWILRKTDPESRKRVLIVTGDDYGGHRWRETAPELAAILREDARFEVSITESPAILGSPLLSHYDAAVIHFKNYAERLAFGPEVWNGLRSYVERGGGLIITHFGCGAFQEWDGFAGIAGRIWNPAMRPHDPHGSFEVRVVDTGHPITRGLANFTTPDELYTCLDGQTLIHVLCEATSKVDQKPYAIGFTLEPGQGRVFHCTLGHDVAALRAEGVRDLYRRAARWAAGLSNP